MSKGKSRNYDRENDLLQRLKHENKRLKRDNARLQKLISRIDIDRYDNLREIIDQQTKEEFQLGRKASKEALMKKWKCNECEGGILKLIVMNRPDGAYYIRKCTDCNHRTRLKKYNKEVEGWTE